MNDRLVLSSSYFNMSGGRRQDSADTFRVLASLQTHAGDEAALYAVSEASAPGPMGARARRLVIDVIQGEYASRFDLAPGLRLRAAVESAHAELLNEFQGHVRVGLTALVADGPSLYLLQVPPAQSYVVHDGDLHSVSADPAKGSVPFAHSLGGPTDPSIALFRDTMEPSDVIVLCSSWFATELEPEELRSSFALEEPDVIIDDLYTRARRRSGRDVTCIAVQAVAYDHGAMEASTHKDQTETIWEQVDDAVASLAYVWQKTLVELSPAGPRAAHRRGRKPVEAGTSDSAASSNGEPAGAHVITQSATSANAPIEGIKAAEADHVEHGTEELPILDVEGPGFEELGETPELGDASPSQGIKEDESGAPARPRQREAELQDVNSFIRNTLNLGKVAPPVQGFPDMNVAPERIYPAGSADGSRRPRRFGDVLRPNRREAGARAKTPVIQPRLRGLERPRPSIRVSAVPPAVWLWSAAGVALVVLVVLGALLLFPGGTVAANYTLRAKTTAARVHRTTSLSLQKRDLRHALKFLRMAKRHGSTNGQLAAARRFIQNESDFVYNIVRVPSPSPKAFRTSALSPSLVASLGRRIAGRPAQLAGGSSSLFALSFIRHQLFIVGNPANHRITGWATPGDSFSSVIWHDPIQLTSNGNTLVALDSNYDLLTYTPGVSSQGAIEVLQAPASTTHIVSSTTYATNYYILDTLAGQIWRYYGSGTGGYDSQATGYLNTSQPRLVSNATSVAIDGNVYVALKNGKVLKFSGGHQVKFSLRLPFALPHLSQIYTAPSLHWLFLVDGRSGRILEVGKRGRYIRTLILPPSLAQHLGQITISSAGDKIYFASGHSIYRVAVTG